MATTKVTFTFDQATIRRLDDAAARLAKPKSQIVREAIQDYHQRIDRLSESEKQRMLKAIEEFMAKVPKRDQRETETELKEIRRARRQGGRRHRY